MSPESSEPQILGVSMFPPELKDTGLDSNHTAPQQFRGGSPRMNAGARATPNPNPSPAEEALVAAARREP
eukprot:13226860-Alexandrium_andersonii.AAC.1